MPVSIVTGASGGIGRWVALGLARAGHIVVIVARDGQRARATVDWITTHMASAQIELLIVDLSSLVATRHAGMLINERYPTIDVLVNNAGIFRTQREETVEGHELVNAVNHLAPFLLTRALAPSLRSAAEKGASARIVNIGSSTSDRAKIDPFDLEGKHRWGMVHSYAQSKLALTMTTFDWARRLRDVGVLANVVHPGTVGTGLVRAGGPIGLVWRAMAPFVLTPEEGADTPLYVALSSEFRAITGAYIKKRQVVRPNPLALNTVLMEQVWSATEMLVDR